MAMDTIVSPGARIFSGTFFFGFKSQVSHLLFGFIREKWDWFSGR
jgi:hypothetical protein